MHRGRKNISQKILVTGSEGLVGKIITPTLKEEGHELVLLDKRAEKPVNLLYDELDSYFSSVETAVHLAANTFWINQQKAVENVIMTWNILENSTKAKIKRIVYASSINVYDYSTLYLEGKKIDEKMPTMPHGKSDWKERKESVFHYSVSKMACEDLMKFYHEKYGISAINLRFGAIHPLNIPYDNEPDDYAIWLSHEDLIEIIKCAITFDGFESIVCVSNNSEHFVDLSRLEKVLGYKPKSDSQTFKQAQ